LRDRKTNFRSFIYSHTSANAANLARIGPVDVQIIGLTESLKIKNNYKTKAEHKPAFGPGDLTRHWCIAGSPPASLARWTRLVSATAGCSLAFPGVNTASEIFCSKSSNVSIAVSCLNVLHCRYNIQQRNGKREKKNGKCDV